MPAFTVRLDSPFSLEHTLGSGQVFRWSRREEWWYGLVADGILKIKQEVDVLRCESSSDQIDPSFVTRYFRLGDDLDHIIAAIAKDDGMTRATERFYGLRLVRQDRWECLASFVLATNANIPRIKKMVASICDRYGRPFDYAGTSYRSFPTPKAVAEAPRSDLARCGLGYRAPFLKRVAASVEDGAVDFDAVAALPYEGARALLLQELFGEKVLLGVGPKVADCVLLYSCDKDEAFPIDVWIARALARSYPKLLPPPLLARLRRDGKAKISAGDYSRLSGSVRRWFGEYAGYAQQYLYMAVRDQEHA